VNLKQTTISCAIFSNNKIFMCFSYDYYIFHQQFIVSNVSSCYFSQKIKFHMFFNCFSYVSTLICYFHLCSSYAYFMFHCDHRFFILFPGFIIHLLFATMLLLFMLINFYDFHIIFLLKSDFCMYCYTCRRILTCNAKFLC
jgi:hypothetical protein